MIEVHFKNESIETFDCSLDEFKETLNDIAGRIDRTIPFHLLWIENKGLNLFEIEYLKEVKKK